MTIPKFKEEQIKKRVDHLSAPARADLTQRYPNTVTSRAIDKALERLRTLEQVLKLSSLPTTEESDVQPQ